MTIEKGNLLLERAMRLGYALPGFDVFNIEFIEGVLAACEELRSPVFLQTSYASFEYFGKSALSSAMREAASRASVPVTLHLDHGAKPTPLEDFIYFMNQGFNSLMVDGSHLSLNDNIALVKRVIVEAHPRGVSVEAEVGQVSRNPDLSREEVRALMTKPDEAERLVGETRADYLAVSVGSVSGFYKGKVELDFELLTEIHRRVQVPLVFHGGTGIPDDQVRQAISLGVSKINVAHGLRKAYEDVWRSELSSTKGYVDPRGILLLAKKAIAEYASGKIRLFGCESCGPKNSHSS